MRKHHLPPFTRYASSITLALVTTFVLLYIMQHLIRTKTGPVIDDNEGMVIRLVNVRDDTPVKTEQPDIKRLPPPTDQPQLPEQKFDQVNVIPVPISNRKVDPWLGKDEILFHSSADAAPVTIVAVQPVYPANARRRNIEGYVVVEFTVTTSGTTDAIRIVEAEPAGIFDRAAVRAASKFRFKPAYVAGKPVASPGYLFRFSFEFDD